MKKYTLVLLSALLLSGCATMQEAYYIDEEFGQLSQASWDMMIAYPDYRYADRDTEGIDGITAEEIMSVYNQTFSEKPTKSEVIQFELTD